MTQQLHTGHLSQRNENSYPHKNLHTIVHSSLFAVAKSGKQPKCPTIDEWLNKLWYIHTMEYYLAMKRNQLSIHATTWMDLKGIMLSE